MDNAVRIACVFSHSRRIKIHNLHAEGEIEVSKGGSYNDPADVYYELHVGDKRFGIGEKLASRMKKENGEIYTVYYYWGSDTVETDLMDSYIMSLDKVSTK